uniref:Uncharacterized protein LOC114330067 n=1 Tax=Diabrotica virgifera virgifera TaxID=50390 RepID=A0A6P7FGY5_DIAVI
MENTSSQGTHPLANVANLCDLELLSQTSEDARYISDLQAKLVEAAERSVESVLSSGLPYQVQSRRKRKNRKRANRDKKSNTQAVANVEVATTSIPASDSESTVARIPSTPAAPHLAQVPSTSASTHSTSSPDKQPSSFHYKILNIPQVYDTQRKFSQLVNTRELLAGVLINAKLVLKDHLAFIETNRQIDLRSTKRPQDRTGEPTIVFEPKGSRPPRSAKPQSIPKLSEFQVVMTDTDPEITKEELSQSLNEVDFPFNKIHRIISRRTNKPTRLVRLYLDSEAHFKMALAKGICIDSLIRTCEAPRTFAIARPTSKYCSRCCKSGHEITECEQRRVVCPNCGGGDHKAAECPSQNNPTCPNCKGKHPAWHPSCPKRQEEPRTVKEYKPLAVERRSPSATLSEELKIILQFTTTLLLNVLPDRRDIIGKYSSELSSALFHNSMVPHNRNNRL